MKLILNSREKAATEAQSDAVGYRTLERRNIDDAHLSIHGLTLTYNTSRGPLTALENFTAGIDRGEFVSILGPSGCGKSTLIKLLSGLMLPTAGEIRLGGKVIRRPRSDVGIVFQQPTLLPWKTVIENVMVPVRVLGLPAAEYYQKAEKLLVLAGVGDFRDHYPKELSGGMQQRVAVLRGLINDPQLLLMDEPFAALDAMNREKMMVELQRIWMTTGKSVVFITHSIPEAVFLSDRVLVMTSRPGSIAEDIAVDIERPRTIDTMGQEQFIAITNHLRHMFEAGGGETK